MGLRFRKSVKIAPGVKLNFNKNSTSVTMGGKNFHYTVNSNGRETASVGIPGTGLSYSTTTSSKKNTTTSAAKKTTRNSANGCLWTCVLFLFFILLIVMGISSCFKNDDPQQIPAKINTETESSENTENVDALTMYTTTAVNMRSGPGTGYDVIDVLDSGTAVSVIAEADGWSQIDMSGQAAYVSSDYLAASAPEEKPSQATNTPASSNTDQQTDSVTQDNTTTTQTEMVWVSSSGTKYHRSSSCSGMKNPSQISKDDAISRGFSPCKKCY